MFLWIALCVCHGKLLKIVLSLVGRHLEKKVREAHIT